MGGTVRRAWAVLLAAGWPVAAACGSGTTDEATGAVRDSAGVRIVADGGEDRPYVGGLERIVDLEGPDGGPVVAPPWAVAVDPSAGRLFVAEWSGTSVGVFARDGARLGAFGREGEGPGEFRGVDALAGVPGGVVALDASRGVLSRWASTGAFVGERRGVVEYWGPGLHVDGGTLLTVTSETSGDGMRLTQRLVARDGKEERALHEVPLELSLMDLPCARMPAQKVLAASVVWTARADTVWVVRGPEYRIDAVVAGRQVASVRRALSPIEGTEALAVQTVESGPGPYGDFARRCGVTAAQLVRAVGHEPRVSPVQWIAIDPGGRLWTSRSRGGVRADVVDVISRERGYEGTLEFRGYILDFLSDSVLVGLALDGAEGPRVGLYRYR